MERIVQSYVEQLQIGEEQTFKNLTVYPLFSSQQAYFAYLTLDEALIRGLVEIGEIDSQGSVPELRLTNKSDLMILILDGEELVGAKQNRIVNTTMLIPPLHFPPLLGIRSILYLEVVGGGMADQKKTLAVAAPTGFQFN